MFYDARFFVDDIFVDLCKEEQISDEEFHTSSYDDENKEKTCYPSECAVEEWNQGKEKRGENKETSKQGHFTLQFVSPYHYHNL